MQRIKKIHHFIVRKKDRREVDRVPVAERRIDRQAEVETIP